MPPPTTSESIGEHRPIRVVCIGAGYSGLMMSIIVEQQMKTHNVSFQLYEMNEDLGGTWLVNRYPGCQCDIPAHNYAFSFAPNPAWPNYYATSEQIFQYMKDTSAKYGCDKYIAYRHKVTSATWSEPSGKWILTVDADGKELTDSCDVLINAGGVLNNWQWPKIPGLHSFRGKLLHSAAWDPSYDWAGKNVAVIGIGSSGVQILPKVAPAAKHVDFFLRSSTWISPAPGINEPTPEDPDVDENYNYAPHELARFGAEPEYLQRHRRFLADKRITNFKRSMAGSQAQNETDQLFRTTMLDRLGSSEKGKSIAKWLLPDFPVGCRRLTPGPGFLEALTLDNVDSHWDNIDSITETGIRLKDGTHRELDAIFCATGFDTTFKPRFPLKGKNGVDLAEKWSTDDPEAYFSITVPDMPNYFMFIGPNSPISNGSLVQAIQMTGIYIYKCINKLQTQSLKSITVKAAATKEYNEYSQDWLSKTVWVAPCRSWYKRGTPDGRVVGVYAGSCFHFAEALRDPRWEDYDVEYIPDGHLGLNRFSWLGNGFTKREITGKSIGDTQTLTFDEYWNLMVLPEIHY
ncbi:hypothetical protein LTR92_007805 [Exophiala xenobiotica]|nr:hypothetical protein LTR92_007805 [Exophiala xenobiotica]KAK5445762.1 hypothetical protein LTR18_003681 [Exophiala xenobiotica]KAK5555289.1 hypothetical protein LTR46_006919 [Exophiala xenobiotica]